MIQTALVREILTGYTLSVMGVHGLSHWGRVLENGLKLAKMTGANRDVVALFSVFHDSRRMNDKKDPGHGRRGGELAVRLRSRYLDLNDDELELLVFACDHHTEGQTDADITVQTCWDSDRLDLWRVQITPKADLLCTDAAKHENMLMWARDRSISGHVPSFVTKHWQVT